MVLIFSIATTNLNIRDVGEKDAENQEFCSALADSEPIFLETNISHGSSLHFSMKNISFLRKYFNILLVSSSLNRFLESGKNQIFTGLVRPEQLLDPLYDIRDNILGNLLGPGCDFGDCLNIA